jgi:hypothetical protein
MTTNHIKAGVRLRKTKRIKKTPHRKPLRFKKALITRLTVIDDELYALAQNHSFLHNSVMTLAAEELDTEFWLSGARANYRWLKKSDNDLIEKLQQLRDWVDQ